MKKQPNPETMLLSLQVLCARSEQCSFDIRRKLFTKGFNKMQSEAIIKELIENRFVDDARFARAYVRDKYRFQRWGRKKLTASLIAKHISPDTIKEALTEIDPREYVSNAIHIMKAKSDHLGEEAKTYEGRQKLLRHAMARGYEPALAIKILESGKLWQNSDN